MNKNAVIVCLFSLLIFLVLIYLFVYYFAKREEYNNSNKYHVVCARYNKDVNFLKELDIPYTILQKGDTEGEVPNIAHESTSYLYYIIKNYDNLPDNVIFVHDENESWHHEGKITEEISKWISNYESEGKTYYEVNHKFTTREVLEPTFVAQNAGKHFWRECMHDSYGDFREELNSPGSKCCAQFIISRDVIRRHKKEFYEKIYDWLIKNTNGTGNGNSDDEYSGYKTSRYLEWSWNIIFTAPMRTS